MKISLKIMYRSVTAAVLLSLSACSSQAAGPRVKLERFDGGFFTIDKPAGWKIVTAGACSTFAFLTYDPAEPLRQIFYFGEIGPVYMNEAQRNTDLQYMRMGGYPVVWADMPIVNPLTPENFLGAFHLIAGTQIARGFMPEFPVLQDFRVVSVTPQASMVQGAATSLVRALFTRDGRVGEGLFLATVAPLIPFTGSPGAGIGYGFLVTGITAPKVEFSEVESTLSRSISSFTMSSSYVNTCLSQQESNFQGLLKAGRTLSEASDIISGGWESRAKTYDIISEKRRDAIMGRDRVYDSNTGTVYEVDNGFYDNYNLNRGRYEMSDLERLPDDNYGLWSQAPLDGEKHIR